MKKGLPKRASTAARCQASEAKHATDSWQSQNYDNDLDSTSLSASLLCPLASLASAKFVSMHLLEFCRPLCKPPQSRYTEAIGWPIIPLLYQHPASKCGLRPCPIGQLRLPLAAYVCRRNILAGAPNEDLPYAGTCIVKNHMHMRRCWTEPAACMGCITMAGRRTPDADAQATTMSGRLISSVPGDRDWWMRPKKGPS